VTKKFDPHPVAAQIAIGQQAQHAIATQDAEGIFAGIRPERNHGDSHGLPYGSVEFKYLIIAESLGHCCHLDAA
jgi:hypothetical protein